MYLMTYWVVFFIAISGLWVFTSKREHLLSSLLSLEYTTIGVYLFILIIFCSMDLFYSLIYITFTACEGALGLSILVTMSRTHGGDYFKAFNFLTI